MGAGRWHVELMEEAEPPALVPWRPAPEGSRDETAAPPPSVLPLLAALQHLAFRGAGPGAWATPLADDPIAFLLDTIGEAVNVWSAAGELVYSNRVGDPDLSPARPGVTTFARGGRRFERRGVAFDAYGTTYVVEVVRRTR